MPAAPLPPDEVARLAALRAFAVLDTPPEPQYDDLTRLAAAICNVPLSVVSLIDDDRQWFKSRLGLDLCETGRDLAFCGYTILGNDLLEVPDATQDPRFADHPFVTGEPGVRFYAGMPLTVPSGHNIGTICVVDFVPRTLTDGQRDALRVFSRQVVAHLLLRKQAADLREREDRFRAFMDNSPVVAFMKDEAGRYAYINEPIVRRFGMPAESWLGHTDEELFPAAYTAAWRDNDRSVLAGGRVTEFSESVPMADGGESHWTTYKFPFRDAAGRQFLAGLGLDVTEKKKVEDALRASEERYRAVLDGTSDLVHSIAPDGRIVYANRAWQELLGYTAEEAVGLTVFQISHPDDLPHCREVLRRLVAGEPVGRVEGRIVTKAGQVRWVEGATSCRFEAGRPVGTWSIYRDVTERRQAEAAVQASEAKFRGVVDRLAEGLFVLDPAAGRFVEVNAAVLAMLGYTADEFLALTPFDIMAGVDRAAFESQAVALRDRLAADGRADLGRRELRRKDGSVVAAELKATVVPDGGAGLHAVIVRDVTEELRHEELLFGYQVELEAVNAKLRAQATTDRLTGVSNRAAFDERLAEAHQRAARSGRPLSLALLDVDHFKQFNDVFGHPAGDAVLQAVAKRLADTVRGTDVVARYGGEEFAVILPDTDYAGAMVLAERCRRAVAAGGWEHRPMTVSVGVATLGERESPGELVAAADQALYRSKRGGRNRVSHGSGSIGMAALVRS